MSLLITPALKQAAQIYTAANKVLTVENPEYPLAVFADSFVTGQLGEDFDNQEALTASVEEHFESVNQEPGEVALDEREALIANVHAGISAISFKANNEIIPAIKQQVDAYISLQNKALEADIRVDPFVYNPIHSEPRLTEHLSSRYSSITPLREYNTFILEPISAAEIIEAVTINNPHLDQTLATEWALALPVADIDTVWNELFGRTRAVNLVELTFLNSRKHPFNIDKLALAYFLAGHLIDNPRTVPGYSVDLEEWERTTTLLHEVLGYYLLQAYLQRAQDLELGTLVYHYDSNDAIRNGRVVVTIDNDVADTWFRNGGRVEAILGVAISGGTLYMASDITEQSETLIAKWNTVYPLIRQSTCDKAELEKRNHAYSVFIDYYLARPNRFGEDHNALRDAATKAIRKVTSKELENPYCVFSKLICEVMYPEGSFKDYLDEINYYGEAFPEASIRELSTQSLISLAALFLAKQITVTQVQTDTSTKVETPVVEDTDVEPEVEDDGESVDEQEAIIVEDDSEESDPDEVIVEDDEQEPLV